MAYTSVCEAAVSFPEQLPSPALRGGSQSGRGGVGRGGGGAGDGGGGEGELGGQCVVWNAPGRPRCCQYIDILFWLKRASQGPLLHTNTNSPSRRFLLLRALTGRSTLEIVELHFIWAATASHSASSRPRLLINEYIGALKSRVSPHHHHHHLPLNPYPSPPQPPRTPPLSLSLPPPPPPPLPPPPHPVS